MTRMRTQLASTCRDAPRPLICSLNKCLKAKRNGHRAGSFAYARRHSTTGLSFDTLAAYLGSNPGPYIGPLEYQILGYSGASLLLPSVLTEFNLEKAATYMPA
jgi:hypothetical protein